MKRNPDVSRIKCPECGSDACCRHKGHEVFYCFSCFANGKCRESASGELEFGVVEIDEGGSHLDLLRLNG